MVRIHFAQEPIPTPRQATHQVDDSGIVGSVGFIGAINAEMSKRALPSWSQLVFVAVWVILTQLAIFMVARKKPYSLYYRVDEDARERRLFRLRDTALQALADVRAWKSAANMPWPFFAEPRARRLCVGIISYSSGFQRHLSQTVGALLSRIPSSYRDRVRITIFNAQYPPEKNIEALGMSDLLRVVPLVYPSHYPPPAEVQRKSHGAKQLLDYGLVLRALHGQGCEYGLVLQSGALAGLNWAAKILDIISDYGDDPGWVTVRLMADYGKVGLSFRAPGDFVLILSMSALLFLLVWGLTILLAFLISRPLYEDLSQPNILTITFLMLNFYIGFILLGKPNFAPMRAGVRNVDTGRLAVANLYPRSRLVEYARVLEEQFREAMYQKTLTNVAGPDFFYRMLKARLEQQQGDPFYISTLRPSLFQNVARGQLDPVSEMLMSEDWPDNSRPITFNPRDFLEESGFKD